MLQMFLWECFFDIFYIKINDLILIWYFYYSNIQSNKLSRQILPRRNQLAWQSCPMKSHTWVILIILRWWKDWHLKFLAMLIQAESQTPFYRIVFNVNHIALLKFKTLFLKINSLLLTWICQSIWTNQIHFMTNISVMI